MGIVIQTSLNLGTPTTTPCVILSTFDSVRFSLVDTRGCYSYRWEVVGRPETSKLGGCGILPILLGQTAEVGFQGEQVSGFPFVPIKGTYIIRCTVNEGGPAERAASVMVSWVDSGPAWPDNASVNARIPERGENDEDTTLNLNAGYAGAMNRWLRWAWWLNYYRPYPGTFGSRAGAASGTLFGRYHEIGSEYPQYTGATATFTGNTLYAIPFVVGRYTRVTSSRHIVNGVGAANPLCQFGIFANANDNTKYPGALVAEWNPGVLNAVGGMHTLTVSLSIDLTPGLYWLASLPNADVAATGTQLHLIGWSSGLKSPSNFGTSASLSGTTVLVGFTYARAYGAMPTTYPSAAPTWVTNYNAPTTFLAFRDTL